jgi:hypothetical protein
MADISPVFASSRSSWAVCPYSNQQGIRTRIVKIIRGGKIEDLAKYVKDYPQFKEFMGGRPLLRKKYKQTWTEKRVVGADDIEKLVNQFKPNERSLWFDIMVFE